MAWSNRPSAIKMKIYLWSEKLDQSFIQSASPYMVSIGTPATYDQLDQPPDAVTLGNTTAIIPCDTRNEMNGVLGHDSALVRLYWSGTTWDNNEFCYKSCSSYRIDRLTC